MIKAEILFNGREMIINDFTITVSWEFNEFLAQHNYKNLYDFFSTPEEAVKFCLEN